MSFLNPFSDIRAHPFQSFLSALAGAFVPGGGFATHAAFNAYNNHNFNNAANAAYGNQAAQGDQAGQAGFDQPLNGALGSPNGFNWDGPTGPNTAGGGGNFAPSGGSGVGSYDFGGGLGYTGNNTTPSTGLFDQMNNSSHNGLFDFGSNNSMFVPDYGMAGDIAAGVYNHANPQARRDYRDDLAMNGSGTPGNYGVSNFMVGGSPVIFGAGDPSGLYRQHRNPGN